MLGRFVHVFRRHWQLGPGTPCSRRRATLVLGRPARPPKWGPWLWPEPRSPWHEGRTSSSLGVQLTVSQLPGLDRLGDLGSEGLALADDPSVAAPSLIGNGAMPASSGHLRYRKRRTRHRRECRSTGPRALLEGVSAQREAVRPAPSAADSPHVRYVSAALAHVDARATRATRGGASAPAAHCPGRFLCSLAWETVPAARGRGWLVGFATRIDWQCAMALALVWLTLALSAGRLRAEA